jgi:hypothetical protein
VRAVISKQKIEVGADEAIGTALVKDEIFWLGFSAPRRFLCPWDLPSP